MINSITLPGLLLGSTCLMVAASPAVAAAEAAIAPFEAQPMTSARPEQVRQFIDRMAVRHGFDKTRLTELFRSVELQPAIIRAMTRPAEAMPWFKYRKIFMTDARVDAGAQFWQDHAGTLAEIEQRTGVPAAIIVAILGVETFYGRRTGTYRVIDALATLAFDYPQRSTFFSNELEQFLILCRRENLDPLQPTGSYAGAMGMPQFMPSSYLTYAADFDGDRRRDIWHDPDDTIASIANYFVRHHWQPGQAVAFPVSASGESYMSALGGGLKPDRTIAQLKSLQITAPAQLAADSKAKLLVFEQEQGQDLWLALDNFYVISRYNHSPLYAMAVYQLSEAIAKKTSMPHE